MSQQILSKSIKKANISLKMEQTMTTTTIEDLCKPNDLLHNRFTIIKKLTAGTFGQIYVAKDNKSKDLDVAIKVESSVGSVVQLPLEVMVMKQYQGKVHGTTLVCYGCERGKNYIVMQLLGENLKTLRCRCPNNEMRFSGSTVVRILAQCLESLRDLHEINFLHRDVKPANFAVGIGTRKDIIYIIDFGLSRRYRNSDGTLRPARPVAGVRGTLKYCSPSTLKHK
uniref:Protein kinase domain-containing protein n=1 Tax=Romanomermis culicivorax TaxID=13658 RepID=A0A915KZ18_ROMCU